MQVLPTLHHGGKGGEGKKQRRGKGRGKVRDSSHQVHRRQRCAVDGRGGMGESCTDGWVDGRGGMGESCRDGGGTWMPQKRHEGAVAGQRRGRHRQRPPRGTVPMQPCRHARPMHAAMHAAPMHGRPKPPWTHLVSPTMMILKSDSFLSTMRSGDMMLRSAHAASIECRPNRWILALSGYEP